MKKSLIVLLAFLVVGALAYAAEPTAELKLVEFSGNASVTLGFDIDRGMAAFKNETSLKLKIQITTDGDKSTTGEGIWGLLKIETDGNDGQWLLGKDGKAAGVEMAETFPHIDVATAQLNFGTIAYLGIKADGTQLNYTKLMDEAGGFYPVDVTKVYGQTASTDDNTGTLVDNLNVSVADVNAANGIVLGITPAGIGTFKIDVRSVPEWRQSSDAFFTNNWGIRGTAEITAVTNLTVKLGASYSFGDAAATDPRDFGFGGLVSYKIPVSETMYVLPLLACDAEYNLGDPAVPAASYLMYEAQAGVRFGWGDKSKLNLFFSPDNDTDWGYYPGITAGVRIRDLNAGDDMAVAGNEPDIGMNISVFSGALVPNLAANLAVEVDDLMAPVTATTGMAYGVTANLKYDIAMAPMTITPKVGVYYAGFTATGLSAQAASDIYLKAGLDIAKIFPNTSLEFLYQSNDFNGGVGNVATGAQPIGMFQTKLKISF